MCCQSSSPNRWILFWLAGLAAAPTDTLAYNHIGRRRLVESHHNKDEDDNIEIYSKEEEPLFLRPKHLEAGELATAVRRDTEETVDRGTYFIGLPTELTERFQAFAQTSGLLELASEILYQNPVKADEKRLYKLKGTDGSEGGGGTWGVRTSNNWVHSGDMTWIDPADEWTYEMTMDIYRQTGFDKVLDTLGEKFGCDSLWIDGTSFIIVSHFNGDNTHTDLDGMEGKVFNILFPIVIPSTGGTLEVADREEWKGLGANFRYHQGVLVGGESPHGTGNVDYRPTQEFRMAIAVYIDDIHEGNVEEFDDDTASFPPGGDLGYLVAQSGRHWDSHGTASLETDKGRKPYPVRDEDPEQCPQWVKQGLCMKDQEIRNSCIKSCNIYLEDEIYYEKLGKLLDWPTETEA